MALPDINVYHLYDALSTIPTNALASETLHISDTESSHLISWMTDKYYDRKFYSFKDNAVDGFLLKWHDFELMFGPNFAKIYEALSTEYAPLENYNRIETSDRSTTDNRTTERGLEATGTTSGSANTSTDSNGSTSGSNNMKKNAFNTAMTDVENTSSSGSNTDHSTAASTNSASTSNITTEAVAEDGSGTEHVSSTIRGNIGVTTSQQMLESEAELRMKWNYLEIVIKDFIDRTTVYSPEV